METAVPEVFEEALKNVALVLDHLRVVIGSRVLAVSEAVDQGFLHEKISDEKHMQF